MYLINDRLATHGLDWQWGSKIPEDQIAKPDASNMIDGFAVLDIRERMLDFHNSLHVYRRLVNEAIEIMNDQGKVVICCSAGVSRSNSIAIGVLVKHFGLTFEKACEMVREKVPIADPMPTHLKQLKKL